MFSFFLLITAEVMDFVLLYFWKCVYTELQSEGAMEVKIACFFFKIPNRWYIIFASDLRVFDLLHHAFVQSQNFSVISSIFSISRYYSHHFIGESLLERIINQWCAKLN